MTSSLENTEFQHFIDAFCIMLLHSLWQGLLIAFVGSALLYLIRSSAKFKYAALLALCSLFLVTCSITFWWHYRHHSPISTILTLPASASYNVINQSITKGIGFTTIHAKFIFLLWFSCFCCCTVKLVINRFYLDVLSKDRIAEPPEIWTDHIDRLSKKLGIKAVVKLMESSRVKVPIVAGHFKPVILFPLGLLANMPTQQVEAILLHELAHIRRNDYLVNLFQNIAEALFFFNPGFLLLSAWLRSQREHCCDDIAISYVPSIKDYLLALVDFKSHALKNMYRPAFTGHESELFGRISRMLGRPYPKISLKDRYILIISWFVMIGFASLQANRPVTLPSTTEQAARLPSKKHVPANDLDSQVRADLEEASPYPRKRKIAAPKNSIPISVDKKAIAKPVQMATVTTEVTKMADHDDEHLASYQATMGQYHNNLSQYQQNLIQYRLDQQAYGETMDKYQKGLAQYKLDQEAYHLTMEKYHATMEEYNKTQFPNKQNYPK